jgi:hypothetical protein
VPTADVWELNTQSFLIRLWIEEPATESRNATWRGHITHVAPEGAQANVRVTNFSAGGPVAFTPGERRYVQDLTEINQFLAAFLREMGVDI